MERKDGGSDPDAFPGKPRSGGNRVEAKEKASVRGHPPDRSAAAMLPPGLAARGGFADRLGAFIRRVSSGIRFPGGVPALLLPDELRRNAGVPDMLAGIATRQAAVTTGGRGGEPD